MNRIVLVLAILVAFLAGALGFSLLERPAPQTDLVAVRAIVDEALAASRPEAPPALASIEPEVLNPLIEDYLLSNPKLLQRISVALEETLRHEEQQRNLSVITEMHDAIFENAADVVLGNPDGDVTLVEFFDYNCGYCRRALPDLAALLAEDPNLRVVLKEFPILSNGSIDAARIGVLVGESDIDYWAFHEALFTSRGQVDKAVALASAQELGLNPLSLELKMSDDRITETIQASFEIASALGITGTPTYIIGNEIIPGAIGAAELRTRIANLRECGETLCS
jgi:protein-disulfide isomerase